MLISFTNPLPILRKTLSGASLPRGLVAFVDSLRQRLHERNFPRPLRFAIDAQCRT